MTKNYGDAKAKKFKVAYAKGFDPDQEDLWEKTYAVSGDDFAEVGTIDQDAIVKHSERTAAQN